MPYLNQHELINSQSTILKHKMIAFCYAPIYYQSHIFAGHFSAPGNALGQIQINTLLKLFKTTLYKFFIAYLKLSDSKAFGTIINKETINRIKCSIIAGSANN